MTSPTPTAEQRPTPLTDAATFVANSTSHGQRLVNVDFARRLERRNAELAEALESMLEIARPHNPQDPELYAFDECPADHPNCCGVCAAVHKATAAMAGAKEGK